MKRKAVSSLVAAIGVGIAIAFVIGLFMLSLSPTLFSSTGTSDQHHNDNCLVMGTVFMPCGSYYVKGYSLNITGYVLATVKGVTWSGYWNSPTWITLDSQIDGSSTVYLKPDSGVLFYKLKIGDQIRFHYTDRTITELRAYSKANDLLIASQSVFHPQLEIEIDSVSIIP